MKVKSERDLYHQLCTEAKHSNDTQDDSDIEVMYPAPDESEGCIVRSFRCLLLSLPQCTSSIGRVQSPRMCRVDVIYVVLM